MSILFSRSAGGVVLGNVPIRRSRKGGCEVTRES
jgi:hypothetical protein